MPLIQPIDFKTNIVKSHSQKAFTLSEVLITLGIIGVVAAITIPNLVANYQKDQTATKLKQTYSMLSQALNSAAGDQGGEFSSLVDYGQISISDSNAETITSDFVKNNIKPYLSITKDFGFGNSSIITGRGNNRSLNGSSNDSMYYRIILKNGTMLFFCPDTGGGYFNSMIIFADINGNKSPNIIGKDIFVMFLWSNSNYNKKLLMYGEWLSRDSLFSTSYIYACDKSKTGFYCGALIMKDGWKISDDYPW